tara:strand:- start:112 stop:1140 length:1029 start_codon:yes stop_codon:yes gene_type:complete
MPDMPKKPKNIKKEGSYRYHRITREPLPGDDDLEAQYRRAYEINQELEQEKVPGRTVRALIGAWQASPEFSELANSTQIDYRRHASIIGLLIGDRLVTEIKRPALVVLRNKYAKTPRKADKIITVASLLFNHALDLEWVEYNPARDVAKYNKSKPYPSWPPHVLKDFLEVAPERLCIAVEGLYAIGSRVHEFVAHTWPSQNDQKLRYQPGKRGKEVALPLDDEHVAAVLEKAPKVSTVIFTTAQNKPWTVSNLQHSITRWLKKAGYTGYSAHGLRHTRGDHFAEDGVTTRESMSWFGHRTERMALHYSENADREAMAESVSRKSRRRDSGKVVPFSGTKQKQ